MSFLRTNLLYMSTKSMRNRNVPIRHVYRGPLRSVSLDYSGILDVVGKPALDEKPLVDMASQPAPSTVRVDHMPMGAL